VQSSLYNENVKKTMSPFMIISHVWGTVLYYGVGLLKVTNM
jgi:hypothetical protein